MKTRKLFSAPRAAALGLCLFACAAAAAAAQGDKRDDRWTWINQDDEKKVEVVVVNKVEFAEDYADAASIPEGGELRVFDSRTPSATRRYVVTRDAAGGLKRDYTFNGAARPFDEEARAWLRGVMLQAVRQGGLDAKERVRRIMARGGVRALVEEMRHVRGDYVRRVYYDALLAADGVSDSDLRDAMRNASAGISSDYERAQLLARAAPRYLAKDSLHDAYFDALDRIGSDYERRRVLGSILKKHNPGADALLRMAESASRIGSDYEKASFLVEAAPRYQSDERLRAAFAQATATIGSDYERGRVRARLTRIHY